MKTRRLVAVLACRNSGSRLYGKPLQRLDVATGWRVLDQVIANIRKLDFIDEIVLAISDGSDNLAFKNYAEMAGLRYVVGDEQDVLKRLLLGLILSEATDLFRVTTESPFLYSQVTELAWKNHIDCDFDATFMDGVIDGCGFEIVTTKSLQQSWNLGDERHRSELCTLFIRENRKDFSILQLEEPPSLTRRDLRLTVDYPEDLVVCRAVFDFVKQEFPNCNYCLEAIVAFLDRSPHLTRLIYPFTEQGYKSMYL
jgi:spore coat polysaccharide biosynthesis protein SpsF